MVDPEPSLRLFFLRTALPQNHPFSKSSSSKPLIPYNVDLQNHSRCSTARLCKRSCRRPRYLASTVPNLPLHVLTNLVFAHQIQIGANTYACINLVAKSGNNFTVNFDPNNGQNKCMLQSGSKNSVLVTGSSSTCVSIGYVEAKVSSSGGDLCATDESIWNIGYATSGLPNEKSGNIKSRWRKQWGSQTNEISFYNNPPGAQVCGSPNLCYSTLYTWDTGSQPNVYVSQRHPKLWFRVREKLRPREKLI